MESLRVGCKVRLPFDDDYGNHSDDASTGLHYVQDEQAIDGVLLPLNAPTP